MNIRFFSAIAASSNNTFELAILGRVMLMTPENIHLNAFMYEPILDMSKNSLVRLYQDAKQHL